MGAPASIAALMSGAAELVLPGVVKYVPLSVSCTARPQPGAEEVGRRAARDLFMHFDKDELGGAVDRDQQVELVLCRPNSAMSIWK
jgi:hypothetical protein